MSKFQRRFVVSSQPFAFDQGPTVAAAYVGIFLAILEEHTEECDQLHRITLGQLTEYQSVNAQQDPARMCFGQLESYPTFLDFSYNWRERERASVILIHS